MEGNVQEGKTSSTGYTKLSRELTSGIFPFCPPHLMEVFIYKENKVKNAYANNNP